MECKEYTFEEIAVGQTFEFGQLVDAQMVDSFAELSGDRNPLHVDEQYAAATDFGHRIVHGMLLASLFSKLLGMYCPGKRCLYLSQDLKFKHPVAIGTTVVVKGEVVQKIDAMQVLDIKTTIEDESGTVVVSGTAKVKVRAQ